MPSAEIIGMRSSRRLDTKPFGAEVAESESTYDKINDVIASLDYAAIQREWLIPYYLFLSETKKLYELLEFERRLESGPYHLPRLKDPILTFGKGPWKG
jgi:hypothetical protein